MSPTTGLMERGGRAPWKLPRGVYWERYTKNGRPICFAVDSRGDIKRRYVVMHDSRCELAIETLWDLLAFVDPQPGRPQLRLVKSAPIRELPVAVRFAPATVYDPYAEGPLWWGKRRN